MRKFGLHIFIILLILFLNYSLSYSQDRTEKSGKGIKFQLEQNYPNPFNPVTTIKFTLPKSTNVRLIVYNTLGQEIRTLLNEYKEAGSYSIEFNAENLNTGLYFYRLETDDFTQVKKMTLLK